MPIDPKELGRRGETRAAWFYRIRGFTIVARNVRIRGGEIDLIAQRGELLVFVEVKTRQSTTAGEGFDAVTPAKRMQIVKLAEGYLLAHPHRGEVRYDVVSLFWNGWRFIFTHFENAFHPVGESGRPWRRKCG